MPRVVDSEAASSNRSTSMSSKSSKAAKTASSSKASSKSTMSASSRSSSKSRATKHKEDAKRGKTIQTPKSQTLSQIYKANDGPSIAAPKREDSHTGKILLSLQIGTLVWLFVLFGLNLFVNEGGLANQVNSTFIELILYEVILLGLSTLACITVDMSTRLTLVAFYFLMFFYDFSGFIQYFQDTYDYYHSSEEGPVATGKVALTFTFFILSFFHGILLMLSIDHSGNAEPERDYVECMVFETVAHRKKKVLKMVASLMRAASNDIPKANVGVVVTDETGQPLKLSNGTSLSTEVRQSRGVASTPTCCGNHELLLSSDATCTSSTYSSYWYNSCKEATNVSPRNVLL